MTLRSWLKKHIPSRHDLLHDNYLKHLGPVLKRPNLWHLSQCSVSRGVAIGLFIAFVPLPLQMVLAALLAILLNANLPIAVVLTWITNPFTFIPINYFIYLIGSWILNEPIKTINLESLHWQISNMHSVWVAFIKEAGNFGKAYFVGLPIVAVGVAIIGYFLVYSIWLFSAKIRSKCHTKKD